VLELEAEVERLRQTVAALEARITDEVDRVHREYRRDLVPLQQAVVLYSDRDARR
jgi:MerR family transcriptional regulator/heat shock protein HspR